ncbi:hypothetical protein LTR78_004819 [Recurvomyces mirabilis]|uniref:Uncharacterized protein n=1 Tax=Recurvomyces mirabilis TaxID=574656 RepID=A0AAE0WP09_9PEZI|nr:hypothetical protein LTR78_004819 [Recurvomyces mirabilis]KAK5157989.1 hypothetical protein LTS14_003912 [Recurvomyces mirabilis]
MAPKAKKDANPIRRSPRKALPSAMKGDADDTPEESVPPAKAVKKTPAKKPNKSATAKKATSPTKEDVTTTRSARSSPAKSPALAKRATKSSASKTTRATKSPSPSKVVNAFARTPSPRKAAGTKTKSTTTRKRAVTDAAYIEHGDEDQDEPALKARRIQRIATDPAYVQHEDEDDMLAPKTKGRSKKTVDIAETIATDEAHSKPRGRGRPKKTDAFEATAPEHDDNDDVMESIEAPALPRPRSRSKSQSPARARSASPAKSLARARSKSPAKRGIPALQARSRSASPAKSLRQARAQSPVKSGNVASRPTSRSRSASPAKLSRNPILHQEFFESLDHDQDEEGTDQSAPYLDEHDFGSRNHASSASPTKSRGSGTEGSISGRASSPRKGSAASNASGGKGSLSARGGSLRKSSATSNASIARGSVSRSAGSSRKGSAASQSGSAKGQSLTKKSRIIQLKSAVGLGITSLFGDGGPGSAGPGRRSPEKSPASSRRHSAGSVASSRRGLKSPTGSPSRIRSVPNSSAADLERAMRLIATSEEQRTKDNIGDDHLVQLPGGKRKRSISPANGAQKPKKAAQLGRENEEFDDGEAAGNDALAADGIDLEDTDRDFEDSDWDWDARDAIGMSACKFTTPASLFISKAAQKAAEIRVKGKIKTTRRSDEEYARGDILQFNNQKYIRNIDGSGFLPKKNPFHELMPAPEVWHRRMPNVFPFGETPFMEREKSRQINEDLTRSHELEPVQAESAQPEARPDTLTRRVSSYLGTIFGSRDPTPSAPTPAAPSATERRLRPLPAQPPYRSPWTLDPISDEDLRLELAKIRRERKQKDDRQLAEQLGTKRKSSDGSGSGRGSKRESYTMSGGLGPRG